MPGDFIIVFMNCQKPKQCFATVAFVTYTYAAEVFAARGNIKSLVEFAFRRMAPFSLPRAVED